MPEQRRKRLRKLSENKRRAKERAAYNRRMHARRLEWCRVAGRMVCVHNGVNYFMGAHTGGREGRWRYGNWDFNLNDQLPA